MGVFIFPSQLEPQTFCVLDNYFNELVCVLDDLYKGLTLLLGEETVVLANGADGRRRNALFSKSLSLSSVEKDINVFNKVMN